MKADPYSSLKPGSGIMQFLLSHPFFFCTQLELDNLCHVAISGYCTIRSSRFYSHSQIKMINLNTESYILNSIVQIYLSALVFQCQIRNRLGRPSLSLDFDCFPIFEDSCSVIFEYGTTNCLTASAWLLGIRYH